MRQDGRRSQAVPSRRAFSNCFGEHLHPTRRRAVRFLVGHPRRCSVGVALTTVAVHPPSPPPLDPTRARFPRSSVARGGELAPMRRGGGRVGRGDDDEFAGWWERDVGRRRDRTTAAAILRLPLPALRLRFHSRRGGRPPPSWPATMVRCPRTSSLSSSARPGARLPRCSFFLLPFLSRHGRSFVGSRAVSRPKLGLCI